MNAIEDKIAGQIFVRTEHLGCPLCGSAHEPRRIRARFGMIAMVAECADCRLAYQTPRPTDEASIAYMNWRWSSSDAYVTDNERKRQAAQQQLRTLQRAQIPPGRLLDFGAGSGTFVRAALDAGWNAVGVERSTAAVESARKFYGVELFYNLPDDRFDVITLWDVVEHLRDPVGLLSHLRSLLKTGGRIVIETGNYESWMRVTEGDAWGLYLLDHHFYFTPTSLNETVRRAGFSGFQLLPMSSKVPSIRSFVRRPARTARDMFTRRSLKAKWPHADVHLMTLVGSH